MFLHTTASLSEEEFVQINEMVYDRCGICLHQGKKELVDARFAKVVRASRFQSVEEYIDFVAEYQQSAEFYTLIDALCMNVTNFFREMGHSDYLGKVVGERQELFVSIPFGKDLL